jgi:acetyltransferase (GNAT) family protein
VYENSERIYVVVCGRGLVIVDGKERDEVMPDPEYRRRGLALLVKLAAAQWAAEAGIERLLTENDEDNVGMLAINERLGYRLLYEQRGWAIALKLAPAVPRGKAGGDLSLCSRSRRLAGNVGPTVLDSGHGGTAPGAQSRHRPFRRPGRLHVAG